MSTQIGEALIDRGLLSRSQLEHALRLQLIFGGHLGTCLVELGYVSEAALAKTLSEVLKMKCARAELLEEIPDEILKKIPREEVARRRVVPFGLRRGSLHVAVTKPNMVGGLSVITGHRIVPYLAPEVYILRAMERYYGIPRRRRYLEVGYASLAARSAGRALRRVAGPAERCGPAKRPTEESPAAGSGLRLGAYSRRMSEVRDHAELGDVILDFAAGRMERCILFHVEREVAGIANWRGVRFAREKVERLALPLEPDSIFALALDADWFLGELPRDLDCSKFYGKLGLSVPREVLVLPIYGESRLEVVLYGDGGRHGSVAGPGEVYRVLLDEVGVALQMLACRQQLCPA